MRPACAILSAFRPAQVVPWNSDERVLPSGRQALQDFPGFPMILSPSSHIPPDFQLSGYDYDLPRECIAQVPAERRDESCLMVLDRSADTITHARFRDLGAFLQRGDLLVLNDTRVIPARLLGVRTTGGKVEMLLLRDLGKGQWEALIRCGGNPRPGEVISFENDRLAVRLLRRSEEGTWTISLPRGTDIGALLEEIGRIPLPPYIHREREAQRDPLDRARYQTVYARQPGAAAAPTAGLHFTDGLFESLRARGIGIACLTLHVGLGTFAPVREEDIRRHTMHREYFSLPEATVRAVVETRAAGRRVVPVGTTSCRVLETMDPLVAGEGWSKLFIYPSYRFKRTDALVTNFHLPESTLLMLVSALAGRERVLAACEEAKRQGYRFYSYGDAMLIL